MPDELHWTIRIALIFAAAAGGAFGHWWISTAAIISYLMIPSPIDKQRGAP
jgi:hypothetical protein